MLPRENEVKQMRDKFRNFLNRYLSLFQILLAPLFFRPWTHISHQSFWISEITSIPNQYARTELCIKIKLQHPIPTLLQKNAALTDWLESKPEGIAVRSYFFFVLFSRRELELESIRGKQWGRGKEFSFVVVPCTDGFKRFQKITLIGSP